MATFANLPRRTRVIGGSILLCVAGAFTAHAGIASMDQQAPLAAPAAAPTGYEADSHFPGAALLLADEPVASRRGSTGTAPLPDRPIPASAAGDMADGSVRPAPPFHAAGSAIDRARALQCLTTAIYYEAAGEPDDGQRAVAQVVLNRVRHPAFPATVCGVVFQGSDKRVCQFSFACDGAMARVPARGPWTRAQRVAARALAGHVFAAVGMATHYHTYAVTPSWNRSLVMTGVFGAHFFHRWKGWWGTPAAFGDRYAGREPLPGPLRPTQGPAVMMASTPAIQATPGAAIVPAVAPPVAATRFARTDREAPAQAPLPDNNLPDSTILDRWKDTGKPLR